MVSDNKQFSAESQSEQTMYQSLLAFCNAQLTPAQKNELVESSMALITCCAYISGAALVFARQHHASDTALQCTLARVISELFRMDPSIADNFIQTNYRLYHRYYLIERLYQQGEETAQAWLNEEEKVQLPLTAIIEESKHLSMSDLDLEGRKPVRRRLLEKALSTLGTQKNNNLSVILRFLLYLTVVIALILGIKIVLNE